MTQPAWNMKQGNAEAGYTGAVGWENGRVEQLRQKQNFSELEEQPTLPPTYVLGMYVVLVCRVLLLIGSCIKG